MNTLSLGPIAKADVVRPSLVLPIDLKDDLERYAELHAATWGCREEDLATLIPHILSAFLTRDRGFRKARHTSTASSTTRANDATHSIYWSNLVAILFIKDNFG